MEPLPPVKEVEYRCYISKIFEELSGSEYVTFAFETAKEFSSFRYEIAVRYRITIEPEKRLEFKVLGMTATRTMMPSFGTARSVLKVPLLPHGIYEVRMTKSDGVDNVFSLEVTKKGFQILQPIPRKRFIDLVIESNAAAPGARHTSTVTKMMPTPLVPRTIQKRQPNEITPEEQAILDSLQPETAEEREAREEAEAFGVSHVRTPMKHASREEDETSKKGKDISAHGKHPVKEAPKSTGVAVKLTKSAHVSSVQGGKPAKELPKSSKQEAKSAKGASKSPKKEAKVVKGSVNRSAKTSEKKPTKLDKKPVAKPQPKRSTKKNAPKKPAVAAHKATKPAIKSKQKAKAKPPMKKAKKK